YKQPIYAERGAITDANGEILAHNVPVEIVVVDTSHLNKEKVAEAVALLSRDLKIDADELWDKLGSDRHYVVLKRDVPESAADALRAKLREQNLRGIYFEIDAAVREYSPERATIILMRPQTGEILAMANRPNFDLNQRSTARPEQMKNRAVIDMMEPGSTFKIVTAAAALNEKKVRPDTTI